ncbi:BLUF domain-containing protein [Fulvimarina sp. MAC3]|uniref:BLUF domain-containing protein n=1 Tax=Fulvimarina sp. MAC3 TaxID=3148887 RepID=UPI0031FCD494
MYRLLFTSIAQLDDHADGAGGAISHIVERSRDNNRKRELTGALLYANGTFIQALEGPASHIETVFEAISADRRHKQIKVIELELTKARLFENWNMAFVGTSSEPTRLSVNRDLMHIAVTVDARPAEAIRQMRVLINEMSRRTDSGGQTGSSQRSAAMGA